MPAPVDGAARVAVVGAGLAGLACAWLLARAGRQVTVLERQPTPGFTASSITVPGPGGTTQRVDVPLRVFYPGYYPTLTRLYALLGVASEPVSYAASFAGADGRLFFRYRNLRWQGTSVGMLAPSDALLGADAWRIAGGLLRFRHEALAALADGRLAGLSVGDWCAQRGYPAPFVDGFLLPTVATVCTCTLAQARDFPASVVVDYLARGVARQSVHRALHGADDVQARLLAGLADVRCGVAVDGVQRDAGGLRMALSDGSVLHADALVLAAPAHQTRRLLGGAATPDEAVVLDGFAHAPVEVLTHTDATLLPPRRRDWSPVNLHVVPGQAVAESTIWVNAVQPGLRGAPDVFQTVHPLRRPRPDRVIGRARFERTVVDARSQQALAGLDALHAQPGRRVWFCGAWAQAGIPLLESAARSALAVARRLGTDWPDTKNSPG